MKPGDMVVCIKDFTRSNKYVNRWPEKGLIYTVRRLFPGMTLSTRSATYMHLEEILNPIAPVYDIEPGFRIDCFRPVRRTDIGLLTDLLAPVDLTPPSPARDVERRCSEKETTDV